MRCSAGCGSRSIATTVPIWLRAPLRELICDTASGRVTGAIVDRDGEPVRVTARLGRHTRDRRLRGERRDASPVPAGRLASAQQRVDREQHRRWHRGRPADRRGPWQHGLRVVGSDADAAGRAALAAADVRARLARQHHRQPGRTAVHERGDGLRPGRSSHDRGRRARAPGRHPRGSCSTSATVAATPSAR